MGATIIFVFGALTTIVIVMAVIGIKDIKLDNEIKKYEDEEDDEE